MLDLLSQICLLGCKPTITLMSRDTRLKLNEGTPISDLTSYKKLVGQLIYLLNTRPNIAYDVQQLSQYMSHPTNLHQADAFRILRYLKNSLAQGLFFPSSSPLQLKAFSYSYWATCPDTRKFVTAFCIYLGHSLISWKSKK